MKILPSYVKKGDVVNSRNYNQIIQEVRNIKLNESYGPAILAGLPQQKAPPFEAINFGELDDQLQFVMKPGTIFKGNDNYSVYYEVEPSQYEPLESTPYIKIPMDRVANDVTLWTGVDLTTYKLNWYDDAEYSSHVVYLGRFTFTVVDGDINNVAYTNLQPSTITLGNDPFTVTTWNLQSVTNPQSTAPDTCNVTIANGYVINNDSRSTAEEVLVKHKVSNGQDPAQYLDDELSPLFEGVEPDAVIYVRVQTDDQGFIEDNEPEIFIGEENQTSIHYQPEPVPVTGDYYYPIAKIKRLEFEGEDGTFYQFVAEQIWDQHIFTQQDLPTIKNVGEKREVFKELEEETSEYKFRTLEQLEGTNSYEIIKKEPENPTEAADKETIEWKYLTTKASSPQIQLENIDDDKGIRIKGNNVTESFAGLVKALSVNDGLVTAFQEAEGWSGEIQFDFVDNVNPSNDTYLFLTIENGLITVVNENGVNVPDAGTAAFSTNNTA
jgi:hypothetical protein